jgi:hypothetical protein
MLRYFSLILCAIIALVTADREKVKNLLHITDENYETVTGQHYFLLIVFYGSDCEDCKALAGPMNKAAKMLKNQED